MQGISFVLPLDISQVQMYCFSIDWIKLEIGMISADIYDSNGHIDLEKYEKLLRNNLQNDLAEKGIRYEGSTKILVDELIKLAVKDLEFINQGLKNMVTT